MWLIGGTLLCASTLYSAQKPPPPETLPLKTIFEDQAARSEKETAQRLMLRPDTPADRLPKLELDIDLRILHRWACNVAAAAQPSSEPQVAARLRAHLLHEAIALIDELTQKQAGRLTPEQAAAAAKVHEITFSLPPNAGVKEMDDVCRRTGIAIGAMAGLDDRKLTLMRPKVIRPERAPRNNDRRTPAELAAEASQLAVSPQLRMQLVALGAAVNRPDADNQLVQMLETCLETAKALQTNLAVSAEERQQMEAALAEGAALVLDPRTREAGRARIQAQHTYRVVVSRIRRLNLSREQMDHLAPLLRWVGEHPDESIKVLTSLDRAGNARVRFAGRAKNANAIAGLAKPLAELEKQFPLAADRFTEGAVNLPQTGAANIPATLDALADEVVRLGDLIDRLDNMPKTLDTLLAFKPRGGNTLDKRIAQLALAASNATQSVQRNDAIAVISDLARLARQAEELSSFQLGDVSGLEKRWTGGRLALFDAKWRQIIAEQTSAIALGGNADPAKIARLPQALALLEALKQAVELDTVLADAADAFATWVDWHVALADLKPIMLPYPQAMSEAFSGFVADQPILIEQWQKVDRRYRPMVALLIRDGAYRDQCATMPVGLPGIASCLATPLDNAAFAMERLAAFTAEIYRVRMGGGDTKGADDMLAGLVRRLGGE
ncbi:MAG: hypothetical protein ACHQ4G_10345 [Opitutales bacterium]